MVTFLSGKFADASCEAEGVRSPESNVCSDQEKSPGRATSSPRRTRAVASGCDAPRKGTPLRGRTPVSLLVEHDCKRELLSEFVDPALFEGFRLAP